MKLNRLVLAATLAAAGAGFSASASAQANEQFFPQLTYRTGAYAAYGIPWSNGKVDYINPHGTGTPVGDAKEIEAIRTVFGVDMPPVSSTKSLTGHSLGAIGVQEAIFSLLMLNNGFAAQSAHIETLDPEFADLPILLQRKDVQLETVMSNSFGFGGTNGCLVMARV